jgi:hypothetical protein
METMISLVTVSIPKTEKYYNYFLKSLEKNSLISEVIVCKSHIPAPYCEEHGKVKVIGSTYSDLQKSSIDMSQDHALSLHEAIPQAKNELIYICDLDVFFYTDVSKIFHDLMIKYDLDCIGICRNNHTIYSQGYFPSVVSMIVKKSKLPTEEWTDRFNIKIKNSEFKNKFLAFNTEWRKIKPEFDSIMPRPNSHYDTGCLLYLWGLETKWKWMSFITPDLHNYYTLPALSKPNIKEKIEKYKILYHQSVSTIIGSFEQYEKAYCQSLQETV